MIKRWLIRLLVLAILGFVARKLMESGEPGKQKVGGAIDKAVGVLR